MHWIVAHDVEGEAWKRLLEYANQEIATKELIRRHGTPDGSSERANREKQARQIRASLLQTT
jgi:hypothetical protein